MPRRPAAAAAAMAVAPPGARAAPAAGKVVMAAGEVAMGVAAARAGHGSKKLAVPPDVTGGLKESLFCKLPASDDSTWLPARLLPLLSMGCSVFSFDFAGTRMV